ncbi:MAG: hypothetical protein LBQ79_13755 [Deltaproteobacteria bacterium]|nr:hypothetical protein [Deltaproteobacteria bacterium]
MDLPANEAILLQTGVEILLAVLLAVLLWRTWRRPPPSAQGPGAAVPDGLKDTIERFLSESEKIAAAFSRNLEDKKNLSADLILKLDSRLVSYRQLLAETEASVEASVRKLRQIEKEGRMAPPPAQPPQDQKANPAAPEVRALVLKLHREGLKLEDIAVRSRLHRGEVELILELERQFDI